MSARALPALFLQLAHSGTGEGNSLSAVGQLALPDGLESGWSRPHRCPGSIPEQALDLPKGRVQRELLVVHARQDVAGGVGVRVQHDSVSAVKPIPTPSPLQESGAGVDLRRAGGVHQHQRRASVPGYRGWGVGHHAPGPAAQSALGVAVHDLGRLHGGCRILAGDGAGAVDDAVGGPAQEVAYLCVVPLLASVPLPVAEVVAGDVVRLLRVSGFPVLLLEGAELVAPLALHLAVVAVGVGFGAALSRRRRSPCRRAWCCTPRSRQRHGGFPTARRPAG